MPVQTMTWAELRRNIQGSRPFLGITSDDNEGTIHTLGRATVARWQQKYPDWEGQFWAYDRDDPEQPMIPVNIRD